MELLTLMSWPKSSLGNYVLLPEFPLQLLIFTTCPKTLCEQLNKFWCWSYAADARFSALAKFHAKKKKKLYRCFADIKAVIYIFCLGSTGFLKIPACYLASQGKGLHVRSISQEILNGNLRTHQSRFGGQQSALENGPWSWEIPSFLQQLEDFRSKKHLQ